MKGDLSRSPPRTCHSSTPLAILRSSGVFGEATYCAYDAGASPIGSSMYVYVDTYILSFANISHVQYFLTDCRDSDMAKGKKVKRRSRSVESGPCEFSFIQFKLQRLKTINILNFNKTSI